MDQIAAGGVGGGGGVTPTAFRLSAPRCFVPAVFLVLPCFGVSHTHGRRLLLCVL